VHKEREKEEKQDLAELIARIDPGGLFGLEMYFHQSVRAVQFVY
jgi:hypothetical protein